jgi:hypothetical protein
MGPTHTVWAASTWASIVQVLPVDRPAWLLIGVLPAMACSAGVLSPDVDRVWAPGREGLHHWRWHRGFTHRVWFASALTVLALAVAVVAPVEARPAVAGAVWGWYSHLIGDAWFGRIKVGGRLVGVGLRVGTRLEAWSRLLMPLLPVAVWAATT